MRGGKRANSGRKPLANKKALKTLSCTADEVAYHQVVAIAEDANLSVSEWVLRAIQEKLQRRLMGVV